MRNVIACALLTILFISVRAAAVGQWQYVSAPPGTIDALRADTVGGKSYLYCTNASRLFVSTDNGVRWVCRQNDSISFGGAFVVTSRTAGTNLFAGGGSVFRSTDAGASWVPVISGLPDFRLVNLAAIDSVVFVSTETGAFRSTDQGTSWDYTTTIRWAHTSVVATSGQKRALYWGGILGVYISDDEGLRWTRLPSSPTEVSELAAIDTLIFAAAEFDSVFVSTDRGKSWQKTTPGGSVKGHVGALAVRGKELLASIEGSIYGSYTGGKSWRVVSPALFESVINEIVVTPAHLFAAPRQGGIYRSESDGSSWIEVSDGLSGSEVRALVRTPRGLFAGTYSGGVFRSTDEGAHWTSASSGVTGDFVLSLMAFSSNLFLSTIFGGVFRSTNDGISWAACNNGLPVGYSVFRLDTSGVGLLASTYVGMFRSTDFGASWMKINTGDGKLLTGAFVTVDKRVFVGTQDGVLRSTDYGTTWTLGNVGIEGRTIGSLVATPFEVLAGTSKGAYRSTNGGTSWVAVNWGLTDTDIGVLESRGKSIYALTGHAGVFLSTNDGVSWIPVNAGLPLPSANLPWPWSGYDPWFLAIAGNELFISSVKGGLWRRALSDMPTSDELGSDGFPSSFQLEQNYPNPFNPRTTFRFSVPHTTEVSVEVFDLSGKKVATLVSQQFEQGHYLTEWNAERMASGVYFCRLRGGGSSVTRKALLVR